MWRDPPVSASSLKARRCSEAFDVVVQPLVSLLVLARASVDLWLAKGVRICLFVCHTAHLTTGRVQCEPRARQCCDQPCLLFFHVCSQFAFQEASVSFFQPCLLRRNSGIFWLLTIIIWISFPLCIILSNCLIFSVFLLHDYYCLYALYVFLWLCRCELWNKKQSCSFFDKHHFYFHKLQSSANLARLGRILRWGFAA